jgi:hypothetical protein
VRAGLVRGTVAAALEAAPGALYALATHIAADLAEASPPALPAPVQTAAVRLRAAPSGPDGQGPEGSASRYRERSGFI